MISETAGSNGPKLWLNDLYMVPFQNYIRQPCPPKKMAAIAKHRRFAKIHLKIIFSDWAQTMVEWFSDGPL